MNTENISGDSGSESSSAFTPAEEAFFSSGGESEIPVNEGADTAVIDKPADKPAAEADAAGVKTPPDRLLAAVHEERGKRKGLEKQLREQAEKLANFEGRFAVLDRVAPKDDKSAGPPTAEEDIFGKVKHTDETIAQLQKRLDDTETANKAVAEQNTFINNYRGDAATFEAKTPDFKAGYNFLLNTRAAELIAIGFDDPKVLQESGADPADVQAAAKALHDALVADEYAIADRAFKSKKSPAEIIYNLAKQRGYKAEAKADGPKPGEQKLDQIERGQQANKTLNAGGGPGADDMTAERLLSMPMDEFESYAEKHPAKTRALMGG